MKEKTLKRKGNIFKGWAVCLKTVPMLYSDVYFTKQQAIDKIIHKDMQEVVQVEIILKEKFN